MDNRGNRIIVSDTDCAINTPAIGAAHVINGYAAKAPDELSLEVSAVLCEDFQYIFLKLSLRILLSVNHLILNDVCVCVLLSDCS